MSLRLEGYIDLPEHNGGGAFDHAAVHRGLRRLHVAHTTNDALDIIDLDEGRYVDSIGDLTGIAGALVAESSDRVFTSNRGEDTVGIFDVRGPGTLVKVPVGRRPNGLAFDPVRGTLLAANVGDPADPTRTPFPSSTRIEVSSRRRSGLPAAHAGRCSIPTKDLDLLGEWTTYGIKPLRPMPEPLRIAVLDVARTYGLASDWVNLRPRVAARSWPSRPLPRAA